MRWLSCLQVQPMTLGHGRDHPTYLSMYLYGSYRRVNLENAQVVSISSQVALASLFRYHALRILHYFR